MAGNVVKVYLASAPTNRLLCRAMRDAIHEACPKVILVSTWHDTDGSETLADWSRVTKSEMAIADRIVYIDSDPVFAPLISLLRGVEAPIDCNTQRVNRALVWSSDYATIDDAAMIHRLQFLSEDYP